MSKAFSVIIPTYNRAAFLAEALDSVRRQSVDSVEVIVVDDASPDPVQLPKGTVVELIRARENGGVAKARNLGAQAATGDALTFLDDDDWWSPTRLADAARGLEFAPVALCGQGGRTRLLRGNVHHSVLDDTTPHFGATAVERDKWIPFDESYKSCEDIVWWLHASASLMVHTVDRQGLHFRRHEGIRVGHGTAQRIADSRRIMAEFSDYFGSHPRAASFRLRRIGLMHQSLGNSAEARGAFTEALKIRPNARDVVHLLRELRV